MKIKSRGYTLNFIQCDKATYVPCHTFTYVFKFKSEKTNTPYVVQVAEHINDFYVVKFYAKKHRKSSRKYSLIVNDGDPVNVLITCLKAIPEILKINPNASFGFLGARTFDRYSRKIESYNNNQRYRIYKEHINQLLGNKTFTHKYISKSSSYALYNNKLPDIEAYHNSIKSMIKKHYDSVLDFS